MGQQEHKGSNAKAVSDAIFNVVLAAGGTVNTTVSLFGVGLSLLDLYKAYTGMNVVTGNGNDQLFYDVIYDKLVKQTFASPFGDWLFGCQPYKVWFNYLYTNQYFVSAGQWYPQNYTINRIKYSQSYNNAAQKAREYMGGGWYDDRVTIKVYKTFMYC